MAEIGMASVEGYAEMAHAVAFPILIANATLLALTSLRNQHVSERARANVLEAIHNLPTAKLPPSLVEKRLHDLKHQNEQFIHRYGITRWSFLCLVFTLCGFAAMEVLVAGAKLLGPPALWF